MRILYISSSIIPSRAANSIHVMKMCQAFADNGHEVVLLAPDRKKEYETGIEDVYDYYGVRKNFEIKKLFYPEIKGRSFFYTIAILWFLLMDKKFGLVYGRFLHGCCVAALLKNKVIFESHAPVFQKKKYEILLYKLLEKSKYFIKLIVISKALKKIYLEKSYLQAHHIEVAHDGADEVFDFETKVVLKGQKDSLKVGYVGHLYKGKGLEIIASIADKVSNDIEFHIIGGSEEDIEYWKSLIERDNVFFYGFIQQNIITHYINALDVCLLPNQRVVHTYKDKLNISDFTSPLKMFEYMAHKKAIISSNLPVLKEVLSINNSILVEPENKNAWVSAINILNNKLYREILSNQALSDFKKFSWKNRALKVLEGLNE